MDKEREKLIEAARKFANKPDTKTVLFAVDFHLAESRKLRQQLAEALNKQRIVIPEMVDLEGLMDLLDCRHVQGGETIENSDFEYLREVDGTAVIVSPPQERNIGKQVGHWWNLYWRRRGEGVSRKVEG